MNVIVDFIELITSKVGNKAGFKIIPKSTIQVQVRYRQAKYSGQPQ